MPPDLIDSNHHTQIRRSSPLPTKVNFTRKKRSKKISKVATLSQISQDCDNESPVYRSQTEPGTVSGEVHIELDNKLLDYVEEL